jgi:hypothetical protein
VSAIQQTAPFTILQNPGNETRKMPHESLDKTYTAVVDRDLGSVAAGHDCRRTGASRCPDKLVSQAWKRGKVSAGK